MEIIKIGRQRVEGIEGETRDGAVIRTILPANLTLKRSSIDLIVDLEIITTTLPRLTR